MTTLNSPLFHQGLHFESAPALPYGPTYGNRVAASRLLRESWQFEEETARAASRTPPSPAAAGEQTLVAAMCC